MVFLSLFLSISSRANVLRATIGANFLSAFHRNAMVQQEAGSL
jgi:hypothetical protein